MHPGGMRGAHARAMPEGRPSPKQQKRSQAGEGARVLVREREVTELAWQLEKMLPNS
jgi:hypothetical protein